MKYIPNPTFNFDHKEVAGGGVLTFVNSQFYEPPIKINIDCNKIRSKFPESIISNYWSKDKDCFAFLREDGCEFAIRFILNKNIDVVAYWRMLIEIEEDPKIKATQKGILGEIPYNKGREEFIKFIRWLESEC
jgi:hypothetical protein